MPQMKQQGTLKVLGVNVYWELWTEMQSISEERSLDSRGWEWTAICGVQGEIAVV